MLKWNPLTEQLLHMHFTHEGGGIMPMGRNTGKLVKVDGKMDGIKNMEVQE